MPIDKFGRHYHDATRDNTRKPMFVIPHRNKQLYVVAPLYLLSTSYQKISFREEDNTQRWTGWAILSNGKTEYSFPFPTGTILRMSSNAKEPRLYVNGNPIATASGLTMNQGDRLQFYRNDGHSLFWVELLVKYPVVEEVLSNDDRQGGTR